MFSRNAPALDHLLVLGLQPVLGCLARALFLVALFASELVAQPEEEPCCTAEISLSSSPPFVNIQHVIGTGDFYLNTRLLVPEPVPLGITATDIDTMFLKCKDEVMVKEIRGQWSAEWSIQSSAGDAGSFLDGLGQKQSMIMESDHVVYVPPRDFACGERRRIKIEATLFDTCDSTDQEDSRKTIEFAVSVERYPETGGPSLFSVRIEKVRPCDDDFEIEECPAGEGCCTFQGLADCPAAPITVMINEENYPRDGMCVGEIRPITAMGADTDIVGMECGFPPCPSTFADTGFCDGLEYTWTIESGPGKFVHTGHTALYEATGPGSVEIKLTLSDCKGGFCSDDDDLEVMLTFDVFDFVFINQANVALPKTSDNTTTVGLGVSRNVMGDPGMNGCNGAAPTFEGPVPSAGLFDPATFRFQVDRGDGEQSGFQVRVETVRAFAAGYETPDYRQVFETVQGKEDDIDLFRTKEHLRLASNAPPSQMLHPQAVYDDQECGIQSILVKLGDWVKATLLINGGKTEVCSISLPVGRPWNEDTLSTTIKTATVNWVATTTASFKGPPETGHQDWDQAAAFAVQRISEDWAQAGIRFVLGSVEQKGPFSNALFVPEPSSPPHQDGDLTITLIPGPSLDPIEVLSTDSPATIATKIRNAIAILGIPAEVYPHNHQSLLNPGYLVIVNKGQEVDFVIDVGGTNLPDLEAPQNWADDTLTELEAHILALNVKESLFPNQTTVDCIVVPSTSILQPANPGITGVSPLNQSAPGLMHTIFLTQAAGDGWDFDFPMTFGHEVGHLLMDSFGVHVSDTTNLMAGGQVPIGTQGIEQPANRRRLGPDQVTNARLLGDKFLKAACIPIPGID